MFELFTDEARTALVEAQAEAHERSDTALGCEHVLLGLLRQGTGLAARILAEFAVTTDAARAAVDELYGPPPAVPPGEALAAIGIDLEEIRRRAEENFGPGALERRRRPRGSHVPFSERGKKALELALREAIARGDKEIGDEHVLLGLLREGGVERLLRAVGADPAALRAALTPAASRRAPGA